MAERQNCDDTISICTSVLTVSPNCCSRGCSDQQQQAAAARDNIVFSNRVLLLLHGCCCSNHAAATVTQHDMENYMVTKSDQTVVGNFHFYITDIGIQALGNSNIAHVRKVNVKQHSHCASAIAERNITRTVQSCLKGRHVTNDSDIPYGRFKYP